MFPHQLDYITSNERSSHNGSCFERVLSFVPLSEFPSLLSTCSQWEFAIMSSNFLDSCWVMTQPMEKVLTTLIPHYSIHALMDTIDNHHNDSQTRISFFSLLKQFYGNPFPDETQSLHDHCSHYTEYTNSGGVTEITCYEPCELIALLMDALPKKTRVKIHQLLMLLSIRNHDELPLSDVLRIVKIKTVNEEMHHSVGYLLMNMLSPCEYFSSSLKDISIHIEPCSYYSIQWSSLPKTEPNLIKKLSGSNDIFERCKSPPYGLRLTNPKCLPACRQFIYGDYKNLEEVFDWEPCISSQWCQYWQHGEEWWGVHCITSLENLHNWELDGHGFKYVIAMASATD